MDHIRQELDQLMGKDRNKPLFIRLARRDHFDDQDVSISIKIMPYVNYFLLVQICKFNLLSFCPNDLFPNTKADIGPCEKRHDDFLKSQFFNNSDRESYEKKYQDELIVQLTKMVAQVDQKIKRSLVRAENGP